MGKVTLNDVMSRAQAWIPLATPGSVLPMTYRIDGETIEVFAEIVDGGQVCSRGLFDTRPDRHSVGSSIHLTNL